MRLSSGQKSSTSARMFPIIRPLKKQPQRLHDFLEVHIIGQATHIMMTLDDGGVTMAAFDDIGIDRSLHQEIHRAQLFGALEHFPVELHVVSARPSIKTETCFRFAE